jgi:hypothetical protein
MHVWGILLSLAGLVIAAGGFLFDTTVEVEGRFGLGSERVVNMQRQQLQLLIVLAGLAAFQAGVILAAAGAILATLRPEAETPDQLGGKRY